jgi:hypothetical protein
MKDKNHGHFNRCRKSIQEESVSFHEKKIVNKLDIEKANLKMLKVTYEKPKPIP